MEWNADTRNTVPYEYWCSSVIDYWSGIITIIIINLRLSNLSILISYSCLCYVYEDVLEGD